MQDEDGNTYDTIAIGTQCWMKQNMRVGTMLIARMDSNGTVGTLQSNNGIIEKYCYNNDPDNCTDDHPNEPDGGLYTWDEAMQYDTTEGAQGICPDGWHIPTNMDLYTLYNYLDPTVNDPNRIGPIPSGQQGTTIGTQLRPDGTSGFEMNYTGAHYSNNDFNSRDTLGFVSVSVEHPTFGWPRFDSIASDFFTNTINRSALPNVIFPVRCIQD